MHQPPTVSASLELAVIGAGPVGLALALMAARRLPQARITVYDAQPDDEAVGRDARTLALSLGTVQMLQRLGVWADIAKAATPIETVHVSQQQPALLGLLAPRGSQEEPAVWLRATELGVPMLGAVARYGAITQPLRHAWRAACAAQPQRCRAQFGARVSALASVPGGTEVDAGITECHDLAVIAEGGVFAEQSRKALHHDYRQAAWVGRVTLADGLPGLAVERFTPNGPAALLPLGGGEAALVWCVPSDDDPVQELDDAQRVAVLRTVFPAVAGRPVAISPLKRFPLGFNAERTLVQGRTVRIGNAAQTLHPVAGQGLNLGLRDAHELVQRLVEQRDIDAALRRMEWQRAPDRWSLMAATDFLARSFAWQWPGVTTLRGAGLAALERLPLVKRAVARQMMFGRR